MDELRSVRGEKRRLKIAAIVLMCVTGGLFLVLGAMGCGMVVKMRRGRVGRRATE